MADIKGAGSADRVGATLEDWTHFDLVLGLTRELLPCVMNPLAQPTGGSRIADPAKVPSVYSRSRKYYGFAGWPQHQTSGAEVEAWSAEPDYGLCIQTRRIRCIDIDVEDRALADEITAFILGLTEDLNGTLPVRIREGSARRALIVDVEGEFGKSIVTTRAGAIEFLATGQHFVAAGRHKSGSRYEWSGGLPLEIPVMGASAFMALRKLVGLKFAVAGGAGSVAKIGVRRGGSSGEGFLQADGPGRWLFENNWALDVAGEKMHVRCAREHLHSDGTTAMSAATWHFAHTGGYERGHFKCLHAHCADYTTEAYLVDTGYTAAGFSVVLPEVPVGLACACEPRVGALEAGGEAGSGGEGEGGRVWGSDIALVGNVRDVESVVWDRGGTGLLEPTLDNVERALTLPAVSGCQIGFDAFIADRMIRTVGEGGWRQFEDTDYTEIRQRLARVGFARVGARAIRKENVVDMVRKVAVRGRFDSAQLWLRSLARWDGVPRVEAFFSTYLGVPESDYVRGCGRYLWSALAGRVLVPGCKADMVPVLVGSQGLRKSSAVEAMVPARDFFAEVQLNVADADFVRKIRGKLVGEVAELRGLATRDRESILALITRTHEEWTRKYEEMGSKYARRIVLVGTTNEEDFLSDYTGNRRWLPLRVALADTDGIVRDRGQLWAEGLRLFEQGGVDFSVERLSGDAHIEHFAEDTWQDRIGVWLETPQAQIGGETVLPKADGFKLADVMQHALGIPAHQHQGNNTMRTRNILRVMGYSSRASNGVRRWTRKI